MNRSYEHVMPDEASPEERELVLRLCELCLAREEQRRAAEGAPVAVADRFGQGAPKAPSVAAAA
jgi:hypothetical protein